MEKSSHRKKNILRILFIITFPLLLVQVLLVKQIGEPYPAFVYPGFGNVPQMGDQAVAQRSQLLAITEAGDTAFIEPSDLFTRVPDRWIPLLFGKKLRQPLSAEADPALVPTLSLGPISLRFPRPHAQRAEHLRAFEQWLATRLTAHLGQPVRAASLHWYEYRFDLNGAAAGQDSSLLYTITLLPQP